MHINPVSALSLRLHSLHPSHPSHFLQLSSPRSLYRSSPSLSSPRAGYLQKVLESHRLSAHVMHIYSLPDGIQNILLSQQIQNARAQIKSTRISWAAPSTHYRRAIKTYCFPSKSRMCALKQNALESPTRSPSDLHLHLLITSELSKHTTSPRHPECARYLEEY